MHICILRGSRKFGTIFRLTENIVNENLFLCNLSGKILGYCVPLKKWNLSYSKHLLLRDTSSKNNQHFEGCLPVYVYSINQNMECIFFSHISNNKIKSHSYSFKKLLELVFQLYDDWLTSNYLLDFFFLLLRLAMFSIGKSIVISCGTY